MPGLKEVSNDKKARDILDICIYPCHAFNFPSPISNTGVVSFLKAIQAEADKSKSTDVDSSEFFFGCACGLTELQHLLVFGRG
jgi:hypothetical protein